MEEYLHKQLREKIQDIVGSNYVRHLDEIEHAVKRIWTEEIKIIRYFTDHGINHSYRIIEYLFKIIENRNLNLTRDEHLILFSSAFLHDIGMQCDLNKHHDIKELLTNENLLSTVFDNNAAEYTNKQVEELRNIHNHASYFWIIQASKNKSIDTVLNSAISNIGDSSIVQDMADVCRYHTKLSIDQIDTTNQHSSAMKPRIKMLAALFRLADELDIDAKRVRNIRELDNFTINRKSKFIWWLHSKIRISFDQHDNIVLTIYINPSDSKYSDAIKNKVHNDLIVKNTKIISILYECGVNISFSKPKTKEIDAEDYIPEEFVSELADSASKKVKKKNPIKISELVPTLYKKHKLLNSFRENEYMYELWEGRTVRNKDHYLIIGKRGAEKTLETAIPDLKKFSIDDLVVISTEVTKKNIEKFIDKLGISDFVDTTVCNIHEFVWENIIDKKLLDIIESIEHGDYTEQYLFTYNYNDDVIEERLDYAYKYLYENYILEENDIEPIFLQASGGTGKSYLLEKLSSVINDNTDKTKKIAFLISSERFMDNIARVNIHEKIDTIQKLIKVYAAVVNDVFLDEKTISQSFSAGNLVILIDGIDEYISIYGNNFIVEDFFQSITDFYNDEYSNAKIVITSRFSPKMNKIVKSATIKRCTLKGFDSDSLKKYVSFRFSNSKEYTTDDRQKNEIINELTGKIVDFFEEKKYYSPFFIKTIMDSFDKDGKLELNSGSEKNKDDLVDFLIDREINRQAYGVSNETVYKIFYEIVLMMQSQLHVRDANKTNSPMYLKREDLSLALQTVIEREDNEFLNKLMLNPLFSIHENGKSITFKFSFVKNYFLAKYFASILHEYSSGEHEKLQDEIIKYFSIYYSGVGDVFQQVVERCKKISTDDLTNAIKNIVDIIKEKDSIEQTDKYFISTLLHLLFAVNEDSLQSKSDRKKLLKVVYGSTYDIASKTSKIHDLYLYGDFPKLDFSDIKVFNSTIANYKNFTLSSFNYRTKFENCVLSINAKDYPENLQLTNSLFHDSCVRNHYLLELCKRNEQLVKDKIEDNNKIILDIAKKFIKTTYVKHTNLYTKDGSRQKKKIIDRLIKMKKIEKIVSGENSNKYKSSDVLLSIHTGFDNASISLLSDLYVLTDDINKEDTKKYFLP